MANPYEPTPFQESNAILLAGMWLHGGDTAALNRLKDLLREMSPDELRRLDESARELIDCVGEALRAVRRGARHG
jgi:hypothetical protein